MEKYIGTKQIEAEPMTIGDYNKYRGWTIPAYMNPDDEGYLVKYLDGYISWSPKKQFEEVYKMSGEMNFGHALELLKRGEKVARKGWNGKGMFIFIASEFEFVTKADMEAFQKSGVNVDESICMLNAQGDVVVGWLASQTDMLAEDWKIVE